MKRWSASRRDALVPRCVAATTALESALCLFVGCSAPTATRSSTGGAGGAQLTAVYSRASRDYVRKQDPDGSFKQETYALKNGGNFGGPRTDVTMDLLSFEDVSGAIEAPLATRNYVPSEDSESTDLLIVVYWGTTIVPNDVMPRDARESVNLNEQAGAASGVQNEMGPNDPARAAIFLQQQSLAQQSQVFSGMEAGIDARYNARNANVLGYTDEILRTPSRDPRMNVLQDEIEHDRYYVVLLAYDYRAGRRLGQHKLLWETRFSIPEQGNDFAKAFPMMASIAATYFGQDSHGLVHHNLGEGRVQVGEPKTLETLPEK